MAPRRLAACLLACLLVAAGCTGDPDPQATPTATPAVTPEPTAEPEPPPEPFTVAFDYVEPQRLDNANLRGEPEREPDPAAVDAALEGTRVALEAYLNRQLVDPGTRLTPFGVDGLLAPAAAAVVTPEQRAALGQLDLPVERSEGGPVVGQSVVLVDGAEVLHITVTYEAVAHVRLVGGAVHPITQRGTLLFAPHADGWRAEVVDVTLETDAAGEPPPPPPPPPPPDTAGEGAPPEPPAQEGEG